MIEKIGSVDMAARRKLVGFGIMVTLGDDDCTPDHDDNGFFLKVGEIQSSKTAEPISGPIAAGAVIDIYSAETVEFTKKSNNKGLKIIVDVNPQLAAASKAVVVPTHMYPGDSGVMVRLTLLDKTSVDELAEVPYLVKLRLDA